MFEPKKEYLSLDDRDTITQAARRVVEEVLPDSAQDVVKLAYTDLIVDFVALTCFTGGVEKGELELATISKVNGDVYTILNPRIIPYLERFFVDVSYLSSDPKITPARKGLFEDALEVFDSVYKYRPRQVVGPGELDREKFIEFMSCMQNLLVHLGFTDEQLTKVMGAAMNK